MKYPETGTLDEKIAFLRQYGCGGCSRAADEIERLRAEVAALLARAEAAERDAARYRHWRNLSGPVPHCFIRLSGAELDAAIDAAMESGK